MRKQLLGNLELNRIYQRDCIEGMSLIPEKSIDMVLCDLPYGTTRNKWDSVINLQLLWEQYERIIKDNGAIVLTAQTPFDKVLGASNLQLLRYEWIWEKTSATGHLNAKKMPMKAHENILVFYKKLPPYNPQKTIGHPRKVSLAKHKINCEKSTNYNDYGLSSYDSTERYPRSVQVFATDKQKEALHPTQKPVALFEYLIRTYTNEGDTVLDNCIGSGTTAVACVRTKRNFIGFETERDYVEIANQRLDNEEASE
jgi:DNA modification methylase